MCEIDREGERKSDGGCVCVGGGKIGREGVRERGREGEENDMKVDNRFEVSNKCNNV